MDQIKKENKRSFGKYGESLAIEYLESKGYSIISANYRAGKLGEIDIIAGINEYICFIEVKTRTSTTFGTPAEAVDYRKQAVIKKLAWIYLKLNKLTEMPLRFDIIEVTGTKTDGNFILKNINHIKNAF
jgi:TIGR00252 family protein